MKLNSLMVLPMIELPGHGVGLRALNFLIGWRQRQGRNG
jgi:ubiquinone/menaquinone biosynthesis C-methylase UbiE